jgi:putative ABC transport system permease protein
MFGWGRRRESLLREFEEHIVIETEENIAAGMSSEEALRAARKKFGNALVATEDAREVWGWVWLERVVQDVRYALRGLKAVPAYTATLVCMLALGLGCVTTMTAIVESILLRPVALPKIAQSRLSVLHRLAGSSLYPIDNEFARCEAPPAVYLREGIKVTDCGNHSGDRA